MKLIEGINRLGTETAFKVLAEAKKLEKKEIKKTEKKEAQVKEK